MTSTFVSLGNLTIPQTSQDAWAMTTVPSGSCGACSCGASASCDKQTDATINPIPAIVEVLFKGNRRAIFTNELQIAIPIASLVVVEAKQGYDAGLVIAVDDFAEKRLHDKQVQRAPLHPVMRISTEKDISDLNKNRSEEHDIVVYARIVAKEYGHDIKITDAEWQLDRKQLTIYFTSPQRIDFRELAKAYARKYKTRIELRQISQRDEAKRIGGFGICGKQLCCVSFKAINEHISIDHNRLHNLSKSNTVKLTGMCGRLKCCLLYESEGKNTVEI